MIRDPASVRLEMVYPRHQHFLQIVHALNGPAGDLLQLLKIISKSTLLDVDNVVGAEGGKDLRGQIRILDLLVIYETVRGIVSRADGFDIGHFHDAPCREPA